MNLLKYWVKKIKMKKIIILGGGYGGIKAFETLSKHENLDITLIDKNIYHYMQTECYDFIVSNSSVKDITIPLKNLTESIKADAKFINDEALSVKENTVICKNKNYFFDYLIIGVGSVTNKPNVFKDFIEVKELKNATNLKQNFELLVLKHLKKEKKFSHIVVVGGGSSGIEIAAQMQNFLNETRLNNEIKVSIIADVFLEELDEKSRENVLDILKKSGLSIKKCLVDKVENKKIFIRDEIIEFDLGVATTGIKTSEFIKNLPFEKENSFLKTDEFLRVNDKIFAVGDCVVLKDKNDNILPPTAQTAEQSGIIAAKNIMNSINSKPLQKADIKVYGLAIALGGKFAIAKAGIFKIDGILAYLGKKAIEKYYKIPLKLKIK